MRHHRLAIPAIGRIFRGETVTGLSEWQLLERYLERRDEAAFEALLARHGPMVLGVCRRMLPDQTDVEDAFQATFLVLVRRARQLGPRDAIGPWLYGVAVRVALRARSEAARRQRRFKSDTGDFQAICADVPPVDRELTEILDQELSRLPPKYRFPIVLCYLEGQTHEEAARQLKWPVGTIKGRLARARELLRSRLMRRGLAPSIGALTLALSCDSSAALPRELLERTVKSSMKLALGQATAQVVSTSITSLAEGVLTSMFFNTIRWAGLAVLAPRTWQLTGAVVMARQGAPLPQQTTRRPGLETDREEKVRGKPPSGLTKAPSRTAQQPPLNLRIRTINSPICAGSSSLPSSSNGSPRSKNSCASTAGPSGLIRQHPGPLDGSCVERSANSPSERVAVAQAHSDRIRELARIQHSFPNSSDLQSAQVKAYAAEAELWLAQARAGAAKQAPGPEEGHGKDAKSQLILAKLDEPISMAFNEETPLEDVLKYIKQVTTTETYKGIPIYVDPVGLQEAEKSMTSTVRNMDLEGIPLKRTLQLLLRQIDLIYFVEDGLLCITSAESESGGTFGPATNEPSPILQKAAKAERGELTLSEMKELIELFKTRHEVMRLASGEEPSKAHEPGTRHGEAEHNPKHGATEAKKVGNEGNPHGDQMNLLLKEMRELIELLKAEKPAKKAAEAK